MSDPRVKKYLIAFVFLILVIVVWECFGNKIDPDSGSYPSAIFRALINLFFSSASSKGWAAIGKTLTEFLIALGISTILGSVLGFLIGRSWLIEAALDPIVNFLYALPRVALVSVVTLWAGWYFGAKVTMGVLLGIFPILMNIQSGMKTISRGLEEVGRAFGGKAWMRFSKIVFPASLPHLFSGIRIAAGFTLIGVILGELLTVKEGLGGLLDFYANQLHMDKVFALLAVMGIIAVISIASLRIIEKNYTYPDVAGEISYLFLTRRRISQFLKRFIKRVVANRSLLLIIGWLATLIMLITTLMINKEWLYLVTAILFFASFSKSIFWIIQQKRLLERAGAALLRTRNILGFMIASLIVFFIFISLIPIIKLDDSRLKLSLEKIGTLFIACIAFITVIGFLVTLSRLNEVLRRVESFSEMLYRAADILEEEYKRWEKKERNCEIDILCYYPTFGIVTQRESDAFKKYEKIFRKFLHPMEEERPPIKIVMLDDGGWREKIKKLCEAYNADRKTATNAVQKRIENLRESHHDLIQLEKVPDYHIIIGTHRALLFIPLYPEGPVEPLGRAQVIGLETLDPYVVRTLYDTFDSFTRGSD